MATFKFPSISDVHINIVDEYEWPVIYDIAGSVLDSIRKMNITVCDICFNSVLWKGEGCHPYGLLVEIRQYKENSLIAVSDDCFRAILKAEVAFREVRQALMEVQHFDIVKFLVEKMSYVWDAAKIPACHGIGRKILRRFFEKRVKIYAAKLNSDRTDKAGDHHHSSKTMAMHHAVD